MKSLKCSDLGVSSCGYVAKGETEQDVIDDMMKHSMEHHKEMMEGKSEADMAKMKDNMRAKMKDE